MIESVKPPWELDLQLPEFDMLSLELELPALPKPARPIVSQVVELLEEEVEEAHPELEPVRRHRRETEIKPELGGILW